MEASVRPEIAKLSDHLEYASPWAGGWRSGATSLWPVVYRRTPRFLECEGLRSSFLPFGLHRSATSAWKM
eukprot:11184746-Karenia_brevis.AAC.1